MRRGREWRNSETKRVVRKAIQTSLEMVTETSPEMVLVGKVVMVTVKSLERVTLTSPETVTVTSLDTETAERVTETQSQETVTVIRETLISGGARAGGYPITGEQGGHPTLPPPPAVLVGGDCQTRGALGVLPTTLPLLQGGTLKTHLTAIHHNITRMKVPGGTISLKISTLKALFHWRKGS